MGGPPVGPQVSCPGASQATLQMQWPTVVGLGLALAWAVPPTGPAPPVCWRSSFLGPVTLEDFGFSGHYIWATVQVLTALGSVPIYVLDPGGCPSPQPQIPRESPERWAGPPTGSGQVLGPAAQSMGFLSSPDSPAPRQEQVPGPQSPCRGQAWTPGHALTPPSSKSQARLLPGPGQQGRPEAQHATSSCREPLSPGQPLLEKGSR